MNLQEVGCRSVDCTEKAQDRDRWRALVNAIMNLRVVVVVVIVVRLRAGSSRYRLSNPGKVDISFSQIFQTDCGSKQCPN